MQKSHRFDHADQRKGKTNAKDDQHWWQLRARATCTVLHDVASMPIGAAMSSSAAAMRPESRQRFWRRKGGEGGEGGGMAPALPALPSFQAAGG